MAPREGQAHRSCASWENMVRGAGGQGLGCLDLQTPVSVCVWVVWLFLIVAKNYFSKPCPRFCGVRTCWNIGFLRYSVPRALP